MDVAARAGIFLQYIKSQRLIKDYFYIASLALLAYDYLLTFHLEVDLVWFSPWSYTKVLFLLMRYVPISNIYFFLCIQLFPNVDAEACSTSLLASTWLLMSGIIFAEAVLAIRTWAVWRRDRIIGAGLIVVLIGGSAAASVDASSFSKSLIFTPPPYHQYRGCLSSAPGTSLLPAFIALAIMDAVVLGFMMISAFRAYKSCSTTELSNVIHRDAIAFYVYLLLCSTLSVMTARLFPTTLATLFCPLQSAAHSILTSRIVFNIRNAGAKGNGTSIGLHSNYGEMEMEFAMETLSDIDDYTHPDNQPNIGDNRYVLEDNTVP